MIKKGNNSCKAASSIAVITMIIAMATLISIIQEQEATAQSLQEQQPMMTNMSSAAQLNHQNMTESTMGIKMNEMMDMMNAMTNMMNKMSSMMNMMMPSSEMSNSSGMNMTGGMSEGMNDGSMSMMMQ